MGVRGDSCTDVLGCHRHVHVALVVRVEALRPRQQLFSHVGTNRTWVPTRSDTTGLYSLRRLAWRFRGNRASDMRLKFFHDAAQC